MRLLIVACLLAVALSELAHLSPQTPQKLQAEVNGYPTILLNQIQSTADYFKLSSGPKVQDDPVDGGSASGDDDGDTPPPSHPCYPVFAPLYQRIGTDLSCREPFTNFGKVFNNVSSITVLNANIHSICSNDCFQFMIAGMRVVGECFDKFGGPPFGNVTINPNKPPTNISRLADAMGFVCVRNPTSGDYCLAVMLDTVFTGLPGGSRPENASICFTFTRFGCCMTRMFKFLENLNPNDDNTRTKNLLQAVCGFNLPPDCPRPGASVKIVKAVWRIKGVAYAYYNLNKETVTNALRKDIATRLGCSQGYISFSNIRAGSLIADFNVIAASDTETDTLGATVAQASADTTTTFPTLITAVGTAGLDTPTSTVGIDTTASTSTVTTYTAPGAGSHVQPMFALVVALLAVAFFVRQ